MALLDEDLDSAEPIPWRSLTRPHLLALYATHALGEALAMFSF